ncbi:DUF6461 domain-containing protein [Amycolatopsis sp. NPDC059657]|uniref:DUF6461 domain-containing protein n=1 Tax=Amycolatopsis sp. NPDC059657 TaxID=3346899 RepID=UPI00366E1FAA
MGDSPAFAIAAAMPSVMAAIPAEPAAELGRLRFERPPVNRHEHESPALAALRSFDSLLIERLLGALELTVTNLRVDGPGGLTAHLPVPVDGTFATISMGRESATFLPMKLLLASRPGVAELVTTLLGELAEHPSITPLLTGTHTGDEQAIAARHGAAHLALAVVTAALVLRETGHDSPAAVVGLALSAVAGLLRTVPLPDAYAQAQLEKQRDEYRLPCSASCSALAAGHRFALAEGDFPSHGDFSGNGLVEVVEGGAVIRTGIESGWVSVVLKVLEGPPEEVETEWWDEIVEVSYSAPAGAASVKGPEQPAAQQDRGVTPPWPGDYRLRVHARGRDVEDETERYELVVWGAPPSPEIVHERTDRVGHRLRGEPEPPTLVLPEDEYRWVRKSMLSEAATVTVVSGASAEEVVRAFGGDPDEPGSFTEMAESFGMDPWVAVLADGPAVVAVEINNYQGSHGPVLTGLSRNGRAASMFWNINALTRLSFARDGEVLMSCEPGTQEPPDDPEVTAALDQLDISEFPRVEKGLAAIGRFAGRGIRPEDVERLAAADVAYPILPLLPELYVEQRLPDGSRRWPGRGPLGADTDALAFLPEDRLRDLAWWAATEAVAHAGLTEDPDFAASLAARALTPAAELRARTSQLGGRGEHYRLWMTLHQATNPDPLAAAIRALDDARYAVTGGAADLLDRARLLIAQAR